MALLPAIAAAQPQIVHEARESNAGRFVHESWTVEDGLPVNAIRRMLQGRDGYLWIATLDGLIRFDGVRFAVYNAATSPELPNNRFVSLHETSDGDLWVETEHNLLFRFRHGHFTRFGPDRGLASLHGLATDSKGVLWAATTDGLGRIDGERFVVKYPDVRGPIQAMLHRRDGSLWVSMPSAPGVLRVNDGRIERIGGQTALDTARVWSIHEDPNGQLWMGTTAGIWTEDGSLHQVANGPDLRSVGTFAFPPGSPVLAFSSRGVWSIEGDRARRRTVSGGAQAPVIAVRTAWWVEGPRLYSLDGLAWDLAGGSTRQAQEAQVITAFVADREGSFWLGTANGGLHRLKPSLFQSYGMPEGLSNANALTLAQDSAGAMWVGTWGGLNRIDGNGHVTRFTTSPSQSATVFSLHIDRSDHMWVGTGAALLSCRLPAVTCQREASPAVRGAVMALFLDSRGRLWAGAGQSAVRENGTWSTFANPTTAAIRAFSESRDGAIWMGTNGAGLLRYHNGAFTRVDESSGLLSDFVRALHVDSEGWLWIGTEGRGLARLHPRAWDTAAASADRRTAHIGVQHGLYDPAIHQILEDASGRFWMSTNRGIFSVARAELMAVADGRAPRLHSTHYTERDGMRNREANGGSQPAGVRSSDGRLWFPTQDGVVVIDPQRVTAAQRPPPVVIERVQAAERSQVPNGSPLRLAPEERDIAIEYTAPSFLEPENLRFRYRLEPYNSDWVDAGNRRTAFYTGLPPGRYSFRVAASADRRLFGSNCRYSPLIWRQRSRRRTPPPGLANSRTDRPGHHAASW